MLLSPSTCRSTEKDQVNQSYQDFAADPVAQARELVDPPLVVAGASQGGVIARESVGQPGVTGVAGISTTRRAADDEERATMTGLVHIWCADGGPQFAAENIAANSTNSQWPHISIQHASSIIKIESTAAPFFPKLLR